MIFAYATHAFLATLEVAVAGGLLVWTPVEVIPIVGASSRSSLSVSTLALRYSQAYHRHDHRCHPVKTVTLHYFHTTKGPEWNII